MATACSGTRPRASPPGCVAPPAKASSTRSRAVTRGSLFAALPGHQVDGHSFIARALEAGAACVRAQRPPQDDERAALSGCWITLENSPRALARLATRMRRSARASRASTISAAAASVSLRKNSTNGPFDIRQLSTALDDGDSLVRAPWPNQPLSER